MPTKKALRHLLEEPVITGRPALLFGIAAVAVPTALREAVEGIVIGVGLSPYLPFVFLSAILLTWQGAALVALISAAIGDFLFIGQQKRLLESPTELFAVGAFLVASTMIIAFIHLLRIMILDAHRRRGKGGPPRGVIFSLENGEAWVSWEGQALPVRLGHEEEVAANMRDFLAQLELGRRLASRACDGRSSADIE